MLLHQRHFQIQARIVQQNDILALVESHEKTSCGWPLCGHQSFSTTRLVCHRGYASNIVMTTSARIQ